MPNPEPIESCHINLPLGGTAIPNPFWNPQPTYVPAPAFIPVRPLIIPTVWTQGRANPVVETVSWECVRCKQINAPHRDVCNCKPTTV